MHRNPHLIDDLSVSFRLYNLKPHPHRHHFPHSCLQSLPSANNQPPHPHHHQQEGEVVIQQRERHGESETFLTPGNLGNFQPMREEEGEGPGECRAAHHTKQGRGEDLLKNVVYDVLTEYPRLSPNQEVGAMLNTGSGLCLSNEYKICFHENKSA